MFKDQKFSSVDKLIEFLNDREFSSKYIYRGQYNISWELKSSLERILKGKYESLSDYYENYLINSFQSRYSLYGKSNVSPKFKLEWLSMMQHYGVPTRMLDFTKSPYVALYFILEDIIKSPGDEMEFVIYAINHDEIGGKSLEYLKNQCASNTIQEIINQTKSPSELLFMRNELFDAFAQQSLDILWITDPGTFNSRIERQAGCFLYSANIKKTIKHLLESELYYDIKNYRIIIQHSCWKEIYDLLGKMNINSRTIYGDLEGLSKSLTLSIMHRER